MKKIGKMKWWLFLMVILMATSGIIWAKSSTVVTIPAGQTISRDKFAGGQIIKNEGTIKGDFFFGGQNISSPGIIEGDAIGMGQEVNLSGNILGNVRAGGSTVNIAGHVGKNVNAFGGVVSCSESATIDGNVIAFGGQINLNGKVKGYTLVAGGSIVLNGEFFGDVDINNFGSDKHNDADHDSKSTLTVLPGTVIHGKLRFKGSAAEIQNGAKVADFQWIKSKITPLERQQREVWRYIWKFIRLLFTTAFFFLIGLLLFKLFPVIFGRMGEFTAQKPWNGIGYGLIALCSTIAAAIVCIILLIFSFIMSPSFGLVFGVAATAIYILLFYLAAIPATLWLGGLILGKNTGLAYRLGIGLVIFNVGLFILDLLGKLPAVGPVFPMLSFIARFGAVLLGTGALLYVVKEFFTAAKKGASI